MRIYSIYDGQVGAFLAPFFYRNANEAIRAFKTMAQDKGHLFNRHSADFTLFEIASWDENTGTIDSLDEPLRVMLGVEAAFVPTETMLKEVS